MLETCPETRSRRALEQSPREGIQHQELKAESERKKQMLHRKSGDLFVGKAVASGAGGHPSRPRDQSEPL